MITEAALLQSNILIVDDQKSNIDLLQELLGQSGFTRVTATSRPSDVCELHRRIGYDLILLDLQMPDMDGFQVMAALKASLGDDYLPVVVLTAQPGHKLRALMSGAKDFISKPFDLAEVRTRIRNMLEVRLLYRKLEAHNATLELLVAERTAELRESEARYRSLTELASDWYWEQDAAGRFTKVSGPVLEMLGIRVAALVDADTPPGASPMQPADGVAGVDAGAGWNETERSELREKIDAREPFIDFVYSRHDASGALRKYQVSGEPMFNRACQFIGYRGIGVELTSHR